MRRFVLICAVLAIASAAFAASRTVSFTDKVTGGSLTITNNAAEGRALELKRVEFRVPSATFTNAFSIAQNRKFELPDNYWARITNLLTDVVSTNQMPYTGGVATFANTNTIATTTNDVSVQVYDSDDFGMGMTFEEEDITTFTFTYTNVLYLIRVYDVYPRP